MCHIQIIPFKEAFAQQTLSLMKSSNDIDHHTDYTLWQASHFDRELFFIALVGNRVVGYIFGRSIDDGVLLWQIAVDKTQQGKGIGKNLVASLINSAKHKNVRAITTTISADNHSSKATIFSAAKACGLSTHKVGMTSDFGGAMKKEIIYELLFD